MREKIPRLSFGDIFNERLFALSLSLSVTEMLVNVLNICSDDELMTDGDDALEEGNVTIQLSYYSTLIHTRYYFADVSKTKSVLRLVSLIS